jgi:hypothetical protein
LNEPLLGGVVHQSGPRWSCFTVLEELVDENSRVLRVSIVVFRKST